MIAMLLVGILGYPGESAEAQERLPTYDTSSTTIVYTTSESAVIDASREKRTLSSSGRKVGRGRNCRLERDTANVGSGTSRLYAEHAAAGETSFNLYCDGEFVGLVWRKLNPSPGRPAISPVEIAERLREEIPIPTGSLRVNPGHGLVGTESWFWIEGYDGQPVTHSTDALGVPVTVEARPTEFHWSFGDGSTVITSTTGAAFPTESEVRHVFERSSASVPDGYPVEVRFNFAVRYKADGGDWIDLPAITRVATTRYPVRESQAVLTQ
jgi:hypothetical protein